MTIVSGLTQTPAPIRRRGMTLYPGFAPPVANRSVTADQPRASAESALSFARAFCSRGSFRRNWSASYGDAQLRRPAHWHWSPRARMSPDPTFAGVMTCLVQ